LARDAERQSFAIKVFRLDITPEQAAELVVQLGKLPRLRLDHPAIATPVVAGVEGTVAYLAQQYVGAESLDSAIRQYGPAPLPQALRVIATVAGALDFAAVAGVRHGALHPRDVLVAPDQVTVTGFGVAAALETIGMRAPIRRPYTAPERVQREAWEGPADVYSLALLARELIVGKGRRAEAEHDGLSEEQAARILPIFTRATAARPADRYPTALEFASALQEAFAEVPGAQRPGAAARRSGPPSGDLLLPLEQEPLEELPAPEPGRMTLADAGDAVPDEFRLDQASDSAEHDAFVRNVDLSALDADIRADEFGAQAAAIETDRFTEALDAEPSIVAPPTPALSFEGDPLDNSIRPDGIALDAAEAPQHSPYRHTRPDDRDTGVNEPPAVFGVPAAPSSSRVFTYAALVLVGLVIGAIVGYQFGVSRQSGEYTRVPAGGASLVGGQVTTPPSPAPQQPSPASGAVQTASAPTAAAAGDAKGAAGAPVTAQAPEPKATARTVAWADGRMVIRSSSGRVSVSVNGRTRGNTPLTLKKLSAGRYVVRVSRRGYATEEREVVISAEHPAATLSFSLKKGSRAQPAAHTAFVGTLDVDSTPPGSQVFLDGKLVGKTPCVVPSVSVGSHVVRVDMIGFKRWAQSVQVGSGQRVRVAAALERETR
jgi:hypothetical protein